MEDIMAIVLVVGVFSLFAWLVVTLQKRIKREKIKEAERRIASEKFWEDQRNKLVNPTPSDYASVMSKPLPKKKPSYASVNTKSTATTSTTTSTPVVEDNFFSGVVTGMLVDSLVSSITHKSGGSDPVDFPKQTLQFDKSPWGLDDSDSRKSISDSMDTSSSWSSSSSDSYSSSSDSGPSSDW